MSTTTETDELDLLERIFLRLGNAETDQQLEETVRKFLLPVLVKIESQYKSVQDKVFELLTHISKQLKSRPQILPPVNELLVCFRDSNASPQLANLSLVYVKMGFPRLSPPEQMRLLPILVQSLEGKAQHQQDSILQVLTPALVHLAIPKSVEERLELFPLADKPTIRASVLDFFLCYLLLPYSHLALSPGLSNDQVSRVTGANYPVADTLEKVKCGILKLLASGAFPEEELICHYLVASGDSRHSVADLGEHHLRLSGSGANWNNPTLVSQLFSLYLGSPVPPGKELVSTPTHQSSVSLAVRLKIMLHLLKSAHAANSFPLCIQAVYEGLFGSNTNAKLRSLSLQFVHTICSRAKEQKLAIMAPLLSTALSKVAEQPAETSQLRQLAFTGIGLLSRRAPSFFCKDLKILTKLFDSLEKETVAEVAVTIQDCLSMLSFAYQGLQDPGSVLLMEALMQEKIFSASSRVRWVAAHYASTVFPFSHTLSRYVSIVAVGDSNEDVKEEGRKGLKYPCDDDRKDASPPPAFTIMVCYFHQKCLQRIQSGTAYTTVAGTLPLPPASMIAALRFLQLCLHISAGVTEEQREMQLLLQLLVTYLKEPEIPALFQYVEILKQSLGSAGGTELHSVAMECLRDVVIASPPDVSNKLVQDIKWLKSFICSPSPDVREMAAQILGTHTCNHGRDASLEQAKELLQDTFSEVYHIQHGAVLALGHVVPNLLQFCADIECQDVIRKVLEKLVHLLKRESQNQLSLPACVSIGHIFYSGPLPLPDTSSQADVLTKGLLVQALSDKLNNSSDMKLREQCAKTLGYMAVGDPLCPNKQAILVTLFQTKEDKAFDLQVTVGEAVSCVAAGSLSTASYVQWKLNRPKEQSPGDSSIMKWTLDTLLMQLFTSPVSHIRQAGCVWLMCILKHAGQHKELQNYLPVIQDVLVGMLGESNELIQEVVSRSISMVYELSGESERQDMLKALFDTLMHGKKSANISGDTELFQKGVLGKTPDGSHITTYRELCSLASDLNQPDLVYKFMHLANHHALWNSKKGAAFGFSSIVSNARAQLAPYLPHLIPRLYRYKYDPNAHIQLAMTSIWNSLNVDNKMVEKYMDSILKDLLANLNAHEWQARQASCVALCDLLSVASIKSVATILAQLWELCLRARDDIKETVRNAADKACKALDSATVRALDRSASDQSGSVKVVEEVLPLLLTKGMSSPSADIKTISLATIMKISKNAGPVLKPHVASLVTTILEMLSSVESQAFNTLSLQLSGEKEAQSRLDDIRIAATKASVLMNVVDMCVPLMDDGVVEQLVSRLSELLKSGTGLATKVASAQFVVTMVHNCSSSLRNSAGKLLSALMSGLSDRSVGVRKAFAGAIGHLVKLVKPSSVTKLHQKLKSWYINGEDPDVKATVALVYKEMTSHSLDEIKRMEVEVIPLVFLGMHGQSEDAALEGVSGLWTEVWNDLVIGKESAMRMYAKELVDVSCLALESPSWPVKAQGARAIATIAETMGPNLGSAHLTTLSNALLPALTGRVWNGKEAIVIALRMVCVSCQSTITSCQHLETLTKEKICHELIQQCKKKPTSYQQCCIESTGDVLDAIKADCYKEFKEIILTIVRNGTSDDQSDASSALKLRAVAFRALGKAWPQSVETQVTCKGEVFTALGDALLTCPWQTQVAILCALRDLLHRLTVPLCDADRNYFCTELIPALSQCLAVTKYGVCHVTLMVLVKLIVILKDPHFLASPSIQGLKQALSNVHDPQDKELVAEVLKHLQ